MASLTAVILAPLFLEDDDLLAAGLLQHGGRNMRAIDQR